MLLDPYTVVHDPVLSKEFYSPGIWGQEMSQDVETDSPIADGRDIHDTILRQLKWLLQITKEAWGPENKGMIVC